MANRSYRFGSDSDFYMCIYSIRHKVTGKTYIGKTIQRAHVRWSDHVTTSKTAQTHLARAIHKYGEKAFEFTVIDLAECELSLAHKENFYILQMNTFTPKGYNLTTGGEGGKLSEETKDKLSKIHSAKHGVEKGKMKTLRELSPEQIAERELQKKETRSLAQIGKVSPRKGSIMTEEQKQKISEARKGVRLPSIWKSIVRNDGAIFDSITDAANAINVSAGNVVAQLKGRRRVAGGFQFKYDADGPWDIPEKATVARAVIRSDGVEFESASQAATITGVGQSNVTAVLTGKRKTTGGFSFQYKEHPDVLEKPIETSFGGYKG